MQRSLTNPRLHFNSNLPTFERFIWPVVRVLKDGRGTETFDNVVDQIVTAGRVILAIDDADLKVLRLRINRAIDVLTDAGIVFRTPKSTLTLSWWGKVHSKTDIEDVIWRVAGIEIEGAREPFDSWHSALNRPHLISDPHSLPVESPQNLLIQPIAISSEERSQTIEDIVALGFVESRSSDTVPPFLTNADKVNRKQLRKRMGTVIYDLYLYIKEFLAELNPKLEKKVCQRTSSRLLSKYKMRVGTPFLSFLVGLTCGKWKPFRRRHKNESTSQTREL